MTALQENVVFILNSVGRVALTESAIADRLQERWPTERGYAVSAITIALKQLETAGTVHRSASGRWTKLLERREAPAAKPEPPAPEPELTPEPPAPAAAEESEETGDMATHGQCKRHPDAERTDSGKCRECQREYNRRYAAKKSSGGGKAAKTSPAPLTKHHVGKGGRRKKNGNGTVADRMVIMQFAIRVEDSKGDVHDLFLTGDTVKRLAIELQEYL